MKIKYNTHIYKTITIYTHNLYKYNALWLFFPEHSLHLWIFFLSLIKYILFIGMFSTRSFLFLSKGPIEIPLLLLGFSPYSRSYLLLPLLIFLSTYKLFDDWHLLTCIVILTFISKVEYFDDEREIKVHLVHQISEVGLSSESFQPTCQINFA